jgi:hypothetical protein
MEETIATDPIAWARSTGSVPVGNVDISAGALSQGQSGLEQRVLDARAVAARYGQPVRSIFGTQDAAQLVSQIDPANFELALGQVGSVVAGLGQYADVGIQELEAAGLAPELVQAMYVPARSCSVSLCSLLVWRQRLCALAWQSARWRLTLKPSLTRSLQITLLRLRLAAALMQSHLPTLSAKSPSACFLARAQQHEIGI